MPKRDLDFRTPLMNAAGTLGFAPDRDLRGLKDLGGLADELGAFVTNPVSQRPRRPAAQPALIEYPGGFLLHTGLPNPGFPAVLKKHAARWADAPLPVIVHLMADRPEETQQMVEKLESTENVMAAELGFAPLLADDIILVAVEMCLGELPLIVCLPEEQILRIGPAVIQMGAAAVSLAAPRGMLPLTPNPRFDFGRSAPSAQRDEKEELVAGRLFGPSLFPRTLAVVHAAARLGLPVIGGGGVYRREQAEVLKEAGALAVQLDAVLWRGGYSSIE
ncbi:MAG: hypothetical protein ACOYZ8_04020 [Chloroflexota bacterium]